MNPSENLEMRETRSSWWGLGIILAMVFAVNLSILVYAVKTGTDHGGEGETAHVTDSSVSQKSTPKESEGPSPSPETVPQTSTLGTVEGGANNPSVVNPIHLPEDSVTQGLYIQHCAACHGMTGRGDGPAADQLYPRPRDFVKSPFRFAPRGGGETVVVGALERTISLGVPRSSMPGFEGVLTESEIAGLARYTLTLREDQGGGVEADTLLDVGRRPPTTPGLLSHGRELYISLGCVACHGESGHGDGPSSRGLVDSLGKPVHPADLTTGLYKSAKTSADLVRVVLQGIPGTPMAAFEQALTQTNPDGTRNLTDAWAVVAFIESLSPKTRQEGKSSGARIAFAEPVDQEMLLDPSHIGWMGVEPVEIELRPIWQREETITHLALRAVKDEETVSLCIEWPDPTLDVVRDQAAFPDGVAVMFAMGEEVPALPMAVKVEGYEAKAPVNIWHWQADRQIEATNGKETEEVGPSPPSKGWSLFPLSAEARSNPPSVETATAESSALPSFKTARDSGNVGNQLATLAHSVLESNAEGFGTLTPQPAEEQDVWGAAAWSSGVWRVVLSRPLRMNGEWDVSFTDPRELAVSFAVWDGSKKDRDGIKLISGWHWLEIPTKTNGPVERADASANQERSEQ
jgi:mono/diheme cytochrome c family protein